MATASAHSFGLGGETRRRPARTSPSRPATARWSTASMRRRSLRAGTGHGAPGLRPHYHADYYGAFVLDPDGHNIEAVCHRPPPG